jgi:hypothetical protein
MHEKDDDDMRKLIDAHEPSRQGIIELDLRDHLPPIFVDGLFDRRFDDPNGFDVHG